MMMTMTLTWYKGQSLNVLTNAVDLMLQQQEVTKMKIIRLLLLPMMTTTMEMSSRQVTECVVESYQSSHVQSLHRAQADGTLVVLSATTTSTATATRLLPVHCPTTTLFTHYITLRFLTWPKVRLLGPPWREQPQTSYTIISGYDCWNICVFCFRQNTESVSESLGVQFLAQSCSLPQRVPPTPGTV